MRVIVAGGRHYADYTTVWRTLDHLHAERPIAVLVNGGASGADSLARDWAADRGVAVETYRPDWKLGRRAGPLRNREMAKAGADMVVLFPGGAGTESMRRIAREFGLPIKEGA